MYKAPEAGSNGKRSGSVSGKPQWHRIKFKLLCCRPRLFVNWPWPTFPGSSIPHSTYPESNLAVLPSISDARTCPTLVVVPSRNALLSLFSASSHLAHPLPPTWIPAFCYFYSVSIDQWLSRCGPWPAANLLDLKIPRSYHWLTEKLGVGQSVVEQGFQVILTHINIWVTSLA